MLNNIKIAPIPYSTLCAAYATDYQYTSYRKV